MIKIDVISNNPSWKNYLKNPEIYIKKKISNLNKKNKYLKNKIITCTLLLSDNQEIKQLNKKFRNKNKITDVLSFPFYNKKDFKKKLTNNKQIYLGDIIVNLNMIEHKEGINRFKLEFNKLWIHGLTHLLGYDHKKNQDHKNMLKLERKLLSYIN